ncbi:MAG: hypothetical protein AMXMBFR84_43490 [Candidatus Hydrogenedentota bacterium]
MRRAAGSVAFTIVEGFARQSSTEYVRLIEVAYASYCEVEYQIALAIRLGGVTKRDGDSLSGHCVEASTVLNGIIRALPAKDA